MSKIFKFKEFEIAHDRCAMKIGTDSVLLGAWVSLAHQPNTILDIGAGTGVIALQLAQRSDAELIDAVEIEGNAHHQAVENFENSSWSDRLFCYHASLNDFADQMDEKYDLIISNPPFYTNAYPSENSQRNTARLTTSLSFDELLEAVSKLLSENGHFALIIPFDQEVDFISRAGKKELFPRRILRVKGSPNSISKRSLLEFSFQKKPVEMDELIIEVARHVYTPEYTELVKGFYLKM